LIVKATHIERIYEKNEMSWALTREADEIEEKEGDLRKRELEKTIVRIHEAES